MDSEKFKKGGIIKNGFQERIKNKGKETVLQEMKTMVQQMQQVDLQAKLDMYEQFENEQYELYWSDVQRFVYRREKEIPGFRDWAVKKAQQYQQYIENL